MRSIGSKGLELIKSFEGLAFEAYPDPATGGDPWTIGYGHTGKDVVKGRVITKGEADKLLVEDLDRFCKHVEKVTKGKLNQNQFDACVSLCYNIGPGNFSSSTLVKLILSGSAVSHCQSQFLKWNKAAGKVMAGLTRRREAEAKLYGTPTDK